MTGKWAEILEEFRGVVAGRGNLLDTLSPPLLFLILHTWLGFDVAMWGSLILGLLLTTLRILRGHALVYALGGLGGVLLAILLVTLLDRAEGFFLPSILSSGITTLLAVASVLLRRPLVAWTSFVARRWPLAWYWHPKVRPAYTEVTWFWAPYFAARLMLQLALFNREATGLLAWVNLLLGWPATVLLLVFSYLYGTWRLRTLGGPSVEEFRRGEAPPWESQRRGF